MRYNHHTDVFFPHAEVAEVAKILLYNAIAGGVAGYARRENAEVVGNQWLYSIFVSHPASAFSRRSETCDLSSVSVKSRGIKTPRSLRSLREIITHHTDVLFPHAEDAEGAKILLYNAIAGGVAGYARQECAEAGGNQLLFTTRLMPSLRLMEFKLMRSPTRLSIILK